LVDSGRRQPGHRLPAPAFLMTVPIHALRAAALCAAAWLAVPVHAAVMTPNEVKLASANPAEARFNAVWSLRAALNVAALQCQFSPFLATVRNYNDFLRHHSDELAGSIRGVTAYYRRTGGAASAQRNFDSYTTRTYQSYSTYDAQRAFCEQAGLAGRQALRVRKGALGSAAEDIVRKLRISLIASEAADPMTFVDRNWVDVPQMPAARR
jgi:hypothetical protein